MGFYETMEIESFYQELIKDESVQEALINELGIETSNNIIRQFNSGIPYNDIHEDFEDVIINCIEENAIVEDTLTGLGGYGEFPIEILNFGPLYWISAQDFDPIKYFKTFEDAVACAEFEYESFLNNDSFEE